MIKAGGPRHQYDALVDKLFDVLTPETSEAEIAAFLEAEVRGQFQTAAPEAARFAAKVLTWSRMRSDA